MEDADYEPQVPAKAARKRKAGNIRRQLNFWSPFNTWWRNLFDSTGKRPTAGDIQRCVLTPCRRPASGDACG